MTSFKSLNEVIYDAEIELQKLAKRSNHVIILFKAENHYLDLNKDRFKRERESTCGICDVCKIKKD